MDGIDTVGPNGSNGAGRGGASGEADHSQSSDAILEWCAQLVRDQALSEEDVNTLFDEWNAWVARTKDQQCGSGKSSPLTGVSFSFRKKASPQPGADGDNQNGQLRLEDLPDFLRNSEIRVVAAIKASAVTPEALNGLLRRLAAGVGKNEPGHSFGTLLEKSALAQRGPTLSNLSSLGFQDCVCIIILVLTQNEKAPMFPLDPESTMKQTWDLIVMFFLMYTTFSVPYVLAFVPLPEVKPGEKMSLTMSSFEIFETALDVLFCTDVILNFCTAVIHQGVYHKSYIVIAKHYLKTWFFLDFFGSVPFDKIVTTVVVSVGNGRGMNSSMQNFLQGLRMVRVLKMIRAVRFLQKLGQLEQRDSSGALKYFLCMFRSIFVMVFVSHFIACFFYLLISDPDVENWAGTYNPDLLDRSETDNAERYLVSLYWAVITITTVGYGDVLPITANEKLFAVISALLGGLVFSYTLGNISSLISSATGANRRYEDKLIAVKEYMEYRDMDTNFKRVVLNYLMTCWRTSGKLHHEIHLLDDMPRDIRVEFLRRIGRNFIRKNPKNVPNIMVGMDDCDFGSVVVRLEPRWFLTGTEIFKYKEFGEEMFFVTRGCVRIQCMSISLSHASSIPPTPATPARTSPVRLPDMFPDEGDNVVNVGEYFGETCLFEEICSFRHQTATAQKPADAKENRGVSVLALTRDAIDSLAVVCPNFTESLYELCAASAALQGVSKQLFEELNANTQENNPGELQKAVRVQKRLCIEHIEARMARVSFGPALEEGDGGDTLLEEGHLTILIDSIHDFAEKIGVLSHDTTDPYVKLILGTQTFQTETKDNAGGNVKIDEKHTFYKGRDDSNITIQVFDANSIAADVLMGEATLNLNGRKCRPGPRPISIDLTHHDKFAGRVLLQFGRVSRSPGHSELHPPNTFSGSGVFRALLHVVSSDEAEADSTAIDSVDGRRRPASLLIPSPPLSGLSTASFRQRFPNKSPNPNKSPKLKTASSLWQGQMGQMVYGACFGPPAQGAAMMSHSHQHENDYNRSTEIHSRHHHSSPRGAGHGGHDGPDAGHAGHGGHSGSFKDQKRTSTPHSALTPTGGMWGEQTFDAGSGRDDQAEWIMVSVAVTRDAELLCLGSTKGIDDVDELSAGPRCIGRLIGVETDRVHGMASQLKTPRRWRSYMNQTECNGERASVTASSSKKTKGQKDNGPSTLLRILVSSPPKRGGSESGCDERTLLLRLSSESDQSQMLKICQAAMSCLGQLQGGEEQPEVTLAAGRSRGSAQQNLQPGAVEGQGLRELKEMVMQMQQQQAEFQKEIRLLMQGQAERHNSIHRPPQASQDIPGLQAPGAGTGGGQSASSPQPTRFSSTTNAFLTSRTPAGGNSFLNNLGGSLDEILGVSSRRRAHHGDNVSEDDTFET